MSKFDDYEIDKFKTWLENNEAKQSHNVGSSVESKINYKKLLEKIEVRDDNLLETIAKNFRQYGGTIVKANDDLLTVICEKGTFDISKIYVRIRD